MNGWVVLQNQTKGVLTIDQNTQSKYEYFSTDHYAMFNVKGRFSHRLSKIRWTKFCIIQFLILLYIYIYIYCLLNMYVSIFFLKIWISMFYQWIFDLLFIIEMQSIFLVHNSKFFVHISTNLEKLVILKVKSSSYLFLFLFFFFLLLNLLLLSLFFSS